MPRILVFHANPGDTTKLRIDKEIRSINDSISPMAINDFFISQIGAVQSADFQKYFLLGAPDIFHFSGHGDRKGIIIEDYKGRAKSLSNDFLNILFKEVGSNIKCVFLNSCYSNAQARIIQKYVPFVIGLSSQVSDEVAIIFSSSFYRALSHGLSISSAFTLAKAEIANFSKKLEKLPVLLVNSKFTSLNFAVYKKPTISAHFILKKNKPICNNNHYSMKIYVDNVPTQTDSVLINYNHESVDDFVELDNDGLEFSTEKELYGDIQLRVVLWYKNYGVGIINTLYGALMNYYKNNLPLNKYIKKALNDIKNN